MNGYTIYKELVRFGNVLFNSYIMLSRYTDPCISFQLNLASTLGFHGWLCFQLKRLTVKETAIHAYNHTSELF